MELRLRGKSTTMSHGSPVYYCDLTVRAAMTLEDAIAEARTVDAQRKACGFDQEALDQAAREGFANGAFEESEEEGSAVVEEFFPPTGGLETGGASDSDKDKPSPPGKLSLAEKLDRKASGPEGAGK